MSEPVRNLLYNGGTLIHVQTNIKVLLKPKEALTLTHLKNILAKNLPPDHINRKQLENTPKNSNVTSQLSKMIRGVLGRPTAYGWKVISIN